MFIRFLKSLFKRKNNSTQFSDKLILAVDDDATQRLMIQRALERYGYRVMTVENGSKGLEAAYQQRPDLILLDVMLPDINGKEICRRLKSDFRTKKIPVIFLTSLDTPRDIIEEYNLGAEIHLTKPIKAKELVSQVEITFNENSAS